MDINLEDRADWERRRVIRLTQVRDQSKKIAKTIRDRVHGAVEDQLKQRETLRNKKEHKFKSLALSKLKSDFNYLIEDVGNGYSVASVQPDLDIVLAEKRLINRCKAISRGVEAEKRQKRIQEEEQMDKEIRERTTHFNKTVEKIRSRLITSVPNIDCGIDNRMEHVNKHNKCFLIPSEVTLNESNIINWNSTKKTTKPWSVVLDSKEKHVPNQCLHRLVTCDNDKENELKFPKLETDVKNYETLVKELNKLSADEKNVRNKLFTHNWMDVPVTYKNNVPHIQETNKHIKPDKVKNVPDKSTELNEIKNQTTEKRPDESDSSSSTLYVSSSSSTSNKYKKPVPVKSIGKIVHFENQLNENNAIQSSKKLSFNNKFATERPLKNINNTLQRIQQKKQLLAKEISSDKKPDTKKPKEISSNTKTSTTSKKYIARPANNDIHQETPTNYAKLPDSFYNDRLETLKRYILKNKSNTNDSKCNESINVDLMRYINVLLKMTPSDVDNLSISSCSSVKMEESILEHSKNNTQYYYEILNCISKCLNLDMSDISQDTMFDTPKNINLLNRLQNISNYYSEKMHEMKSICDESLQISNNELEEQNIEIENEVPKNLSVNVSSNSSVDGEYILGHLNTLLRKKGLIKTDKEWPMFENKSDDDDNRSLTDQLLDVYPHQSCTYQKQYVQQYIGHTKNETPLQHPLENINEMLNWIKKKKRLLFDEIYTNQVPISDMHSMNSKSDTYKDTQKEDPNHYVGLPDSFYNSTLKVLEEYVKNKKQKKSKSNNNNTWINMELMRYICSLLKMSPNEIDGLSVLSNSSNQLEQSILEISKANLEYHKDILNYMSEYLDSNMYGDINRDQTFSSPQYIGLLDKLYKLADYYTEKAHEMRNICLESPRIEINNLDTDTVKKISEKNPEDRKTSCSLSSELSIDGAYVLDHLSTLLEQRGLICTDREWPIFGNDDEEDSRSLTDQLLDIKPQIKDIKVECSEKDPDVSPPPIVSPQ